MINKIAALVLFILFAQHLMAQSTAQDWIKNDCDGNPHHLFAELDSGKIIIIAYVMVPGCNGCIDATIATGTVQTSFSSAYPGRVKNYSIGYDDAYTCTDMLDWKSSNFLHTTVFTDGAADVAYYGGMGMPTVIVLGGSDHHVYYNQFGFTFPDTANLRTAIQNALNGNTGIENTSLQSISIFPNPAKDYIMLTLPQNKMEDLWLQFYNSTGEKFNEIKNPGNSIKLENTLLVPGIYTVMLISETNQFHSIKKLIIVK